MADVAQKTFFNHFATKQQLVSEIATTFLQDLFNTLDELRQTKGSVADRLHVFFATLADRCDAAGPMHRELVLAVIRVAHLQQHESTQMRFVRDAFRSFLADGREGRTANDDLESLTDIVVGAFYAQMLNWVSLDDYPLRQRSAAAGRFLAQAIARAR
jgi:AcrR family transcriptional regulator